MNSGVRRRSLLEGLMAGLLFGSAAVLIRLLNMNVFSTSIWRLIIASIILAFAILVFRQKLDVRLVGHNAKDFLVLGMLLGIHFIFFVSAVKNTSILNATVLVNTTPIFSLVISTFIYKLNPSKIALAGIFLSFIGACVIVYGDTKAGESGNLIGDIEAAIAALAEGFYLNYGRERRSRFPLLPTMLFLYLAATLTVGVATIATGTTFDTTINLANILPLIGLGILPTAAAHTLYFSSLSNLKSFETATLALIEPIGATLLGIVLFAEVPTSVFVLGATVLLIGVFAVGMGE
jgi:drug/metabolite transporter (DMT)-like permease